MNSLLIMREDERLFETAAIDRFLKMESGFRDVRADGPAGAVLEAEYGTPDNWTTLSLSENLDTVSLTLISDIALQVALMLQQRLEIPLRMFDTNYTFDLILVGMQTVEELKIAIGNSYVD
jgi:hypothetical protein